VQGLLQIDNDLTAVGESQRDHAPHALVVNVHIGIVVQQVAAVFYPSQQAFSLVQKFKVGHYNRSMLKVPKILVTTFVLVGSAAVLSGCGQKGPLRTPDSPASANRATLPQTLNPWHDPSKGQISRQEPDTSTLATKPRPAPSVAPDTLFLISPSASDAVTR
jgi:predicted small lipoprotein YifL